MGYKYNLSIFIFRRDFRLQDNVGLIAALSESKKVIPVFIFTEKQINKKKNHFKSERQVRFMTECLQDLNKYLSKHKSKLHIFHSTPKKVIQAMADTIDAVYVNEDYTPFSIKRDLLIKKTCDAKKIAFHSHRDYLLNPPKSILTDGGTVYVKFTPFYGKAIEFGDYPVKNKHKNYYTKNLKVKDIKSIAIKDISQYYDLTNTEISSILKKGGRKNAISILKKMCDYDQYNERRNDLTYQTTQLSAFIKFGSVSIREVMETIEDKLGSSNDLMKQLYWREFYYNIMIAYPRVISGTNRNYKKKYQKVPWKRESSASKKDKLMITAWKNGTTGFPIVDACMRQLNTTGYMHNRGRMIVASFLTKNMMWHWEDGEKYFATRLIDYDPAVNNGNWQWCSGSGVDAQPYFRVFNPWSQGEKHDKKAIYIKKWIPELSNVPAKEIHQWDQSYKKYKDINYNKPMLNHSKTSKAAKAIFKRAV
jgi:deoxyribodipyrimidine photo-lyase